MTVRSPKRRVLGLMSGTSMDGLDMCLADVYLDRNYSFEYKIIKNRYEEFDKKTIEFIKKTISDRCFLNDLNNHISIKYLEIINKHYFNDNIDLISMHGQTIHHIDKVISIQAGDPKILYNRFKVPIIYNFRHADIKHGGSGAPLMPFLDWLLFKDYNQDIVTLNIGGISNISYIPRNSNLEGVIGFDTGPGMSLIDEFVNLKWKIKFDINGSLALKGKINTDLLTMVLNHPYINRRPPKSTGREDFGLVMIKSLIKLFPEINKLDFLRTLVRVTAESIILNLKHINGICFKDSILITSGGGINNKLLIEDINEICDFNKIVTSKKIGINPDMKEALLMSVLGLGRYMNLNTNVPNATGASKYISCGDIYG